jgi:hypothetical protein
MRSLIRAALGLALALALGAVAAITVQEPAFAASTYCHASGSCPVFAGPNSGYYYAEIPNYSSVSMICWTDAQWYSVNYWSNRWFKVNTVYTGPTWMHSSEVYNQTTVGHC